LEILKRETIHDMNSAVVLRV